MTRFKSLFAALVTVVTVAVVPALNAQTTHYIGVGSSAMFQGFAVAANNDLGVGDVCPAGVLPGGDACSVHHWSKDAGTAFGQAVDGRATGIPNEAGNIWVVYVHDDTAGTDTDVWAYLSIDSTVGVRNYLATPRATLLVNAGATSTAGDNKIKNTLFVGNTFDETAGIPADVFNAINGKTFTAGMTDIRPEDALLATNRIIATDCPVGTDSAAAPASCGDTVPTITNPWIYSFTLNYGTRTSNTGTGIKSGISGSTAQANPVRFALPGFNDPITGQPVPSTIQVYPVGVSPIIFVANRQNTTTGLGQTQASDGSYYARNVWDQHPYPPQANVYPNLNQPASCSGTPNSGACHVTRRPLGNLFSGGDCETDSSAFTWPLDPNTEGLRSHPPNGTANPITLYLREPLSGTYNTIEYTEMRLFGTPGGSDGGSPGAPYERPAYVSQETNVIASTDNPLNKKCPAKYTGPGEPADTSEGTRIRGIGTGEVINGITSATVGGVKNTVDSLGYAFFSFGNVSKIAKSTNYGYLMLDGVDPIFNEYSNTSGNPGQPASPGAPTSWGELPACTPGGTPDCRASAIWNGGVSYPNLRNGTYPAWSELRMMCDPSVSTDHCTVGVDSLGAQALVHAKQDDIHNNNLGGVPDLLPFSGDGSFGSSGYGDVSYIREHYTFLPKGASSFSTGFAPDDTDLAGKADQFTSAFPTTNHQGGSDKDLPIDFSKEACSGGSAPGTPKNGPTPISECGGDAGGFIVPVGTATTGNLQ